MQNVPNPVPRVAHPDWLHKRVATRLDKRKQHTLSSMFGKPSAHNEKRGAGADSGVATGAHADSDVDMEDMAVLTHSGAAAARQGKKRRKLATLWRVRCASQFDQAA